MEGHYYGRFDPKATKAQLWAYLEAEVAFAKQQDKLAKRNYENFIKRRNDLLEANNRYLERARNAEAGQRVAQREMMEALDRIDFMQGEYDAAVNQHLEQDTWARMEIERLKREISDWEKVVSDWQIEAKAWASMYGIQRQHHEAEYAKVNKWIKRLSELARFRLFVFDLPLAVIGFLVMAGAVPPIFPDFPWWWK
jgi:hypothetical protein